ncbi:CDGSH iron-sulfur domain-containing protein [Streptomyces liangshanensis]|uniref:CDGSH iron-sulfur domain-containing protein n=1 Tax=Streptomyces liangshanensis TaxID=2717324 RepID=UPI0036DE95C0
MARDPAEEPDGRPPVRLRVQRDGPTLVDGPVTVELDDGATATSDRFRVALCTCRRSRRFPWCDTSHRRRGRG